MTVTLSIVLGPHGQVEDIRSGAVRIEGVEPDFTVFKRMPDVYKLQARIQKFQICEMAPTAYLMARAAGAPITALPLPMTRRFRHQGLMRLKNSDVKTPKDLEGKAVGLRAYTVTAPVWTRGIFAEEYGLDLNKVTWVTQEDEADTSYQLPPNVQRCARGKSLVDMLREGELAAAFGGLAGMGDAGDLQLVDFIEDSEQIEYDWYKRTGIYPIHGVITLRDDVLVDMPELPQALFRAFTTARDNYWARLQAGAEPDADGRRYLRLEPVVGNPLPYGIEDNRKSFEALIRFAHSQNLIDRAPAVEQVFLDPESSQKQLPKWLEI